MHTTQKKLYLNQVIQNPKTPGIENFKPKKIVRSFPSLETQCTLCDFMPWSEWKDWHESTRQLTQSLPILYHNSFEYHRHHLPDCCCSSGADRGIFSEIQLETQDHGLQRSIICKEKTMKILKMKKTTEKRQYMYHVLQCDCYHFY